MKKYQLGALTVSDKGLQDTKEEVVIELIDRMQKYVAEGKAAYENGDYTTEQKLNAKVTMISKGAKHPYHLAKESGGGSTVYGWVNAADVQSEADAAIEKRGFSVPDERRLAGEGKKKAPLSNREKDWEASKREEY